MEVAGAGYTANMTLNYGPTLAYVGLFAPSVITGAYLLAVLRGDILILFVPDYSMTVSSVLSERQKIQFNYNMQEHIKFLCNLAIAESNAFHILGVSGHCGGCKCINSMPMCAVQATLIQS